MALRALSSIADSVSFRIADQPALLKIGSAIHDELSKPVTPRAHHQVGGTCYAAASATVVHAALQRMRGCELPSWQSLYDELTTTFGFNGAVTEDAVAHLCKKYGIRYRALSDQEVGLTLARNRPVLATFALSDKDWDTFSDHFARHPTVPLATPLRDNTGHGGGHAVVIVGDQETSWLIKNSWGEEFADSGRFSVKKDALVCRTYIDVFFTNDDLKAKGLWKWHGGFLPFL